MKRLELFLALLIAWVLLVWPFAPDTGVPMLQDIVAGLLAALLAATLMTALPPTSVNPPFNPLRLPWFAVYVGVLAWYVVKANVDVAYRVLHPEMPIRPGIVKIKTQLKTRAALTMLANSITLTPGTLTVNVLEDGTLYVHWIFVRTEDPEEAARAITGRFEGLLKRVFE